MKMVLARLLSLAGIPAVATLCGAGYALFRPPGEKARSAYQHFAAGVVMAVVAGELLLRQAFPSMRAFDP